MDALRLCSKSFFWTAFCIFEHNCIACLAAVIDSRSVTWCGFRSPLLFFSFLILRHLIASCWFIECVTVHALSTIIISFYAKLESWCLSFSLCFCFFSGFFPKLEPSEATHVTRWFNRCKWQRRIIIFIVSTWNKNALQAVKITQVRRKISMTKD